MKKFYLGALGCLMAMGAGAQSLKQQGTAQGNYWELQAIPTEYAYEGKSSVYSIGETDAEVEFTVYNKEFGVDRTIKVTKPANHKRREVEARKMVNTEKTAECAKTVEADEQEIYGYDSYYYRYCCTDVTCTDEYVEEWAESQGYDIIEKREVDGNTLFVYENSDSYLRGYLFKDNTLYNYTCYQWSGEEELYSGWDGEVYRAYYNSKTVDVVFARELVESYINYIGQNGYGRFGFDFYDSYSVTEITTAETGETYFYTNMYRWFDNEQYSRLYFVWKDQSITVHYVSEFSFTGEWEKEADGENEPYDNWLDHTGVWSLRVGDFGKTYDEYGICATQTVFNNDEKWEFLRPVYAPVKSEDEYYTYERDRDGDGEIDYKYTTYENMVKAYEVVNEDGTVLATIDVPENDNCDAILIQWDGVTYLGMSVSNRVYLNSSDYDYEYEGYTVIYSIDRNATEIKRVAATPAMRVSPSLVNRNSTVNVTLGSETAKDGGELIITDSNGRAIGRRRVEVGQTSVPVTTDRMTSGVYNITLTEKGQKVENARIIVK